MEDHLFIHGNDKIDAISHISNLNCMSNLRYFFSNQLHGSESRTADKGTGAGEARSFRNSSIHEKIHAGRACPSAVLHDALVAAEKIVVPAQAGLVYGNG